MRMRTDIRAAAVVLVVACAIFAASAAADGDPASDVLYGQHYYVPAGKLRPDRIADLKRAISAAYAKGYRVKVAVIAAPVDLGSIPTLFDRPDLYAKFLGREISTYYVGPLLVVMPDGFGLYNGARSMVAGRRALRKVKPAGAGPDDLVRTAASAVRTLAGAGALVWRDVLPPRLFLFTSYGQPGQTAQLRYSVLDDSGYARVTFTIVTLQGAEIGRVATGLTRIDLHGLPTIRWQVPVDAANELRFCGDAWDAAGHRSLHSCGRLDVS
jgi:hypothetical protein